MNQGLALLVGWVQFGAVLCLLGFFLLRHRAD